MFDADEEDRSTRNRPPAIDLAVSGDPCMAVLSKTDETLTIF